MTNNNCIDERKGLKDFFVFYKIIQNAPRIARNIR